MLPPSLLSNRQLSAACLYAVQPPTLCCLPFCCPTANSLLLASMLSNRQLSAACFSAVQPPTPCCLPLCYPATNSLLLASLLSSHQLPAASPLCCPTANSLLLASLLSSRQLPLCCPAANCLSAGSRCQLPFASPYHFRIRRDFMSKNPLSGFAPKQTRLPWRPTHIVLHTHAELYSTLPFIWCCEEGRFAAWPTTIYLYNLVPTKIQLQIYRLS